MDRKLAELIFETLKAGGVETEGVQIFPPIKLDYFHATNNPENMTAGFIFKSGEMASMIILPQEDAKLLGQRLIEMSTRAMEN